MTHLLNEKLLTGNLNCGNDGNRGVGTSLVAFWEVRPERSEEVWPVTHAVDRAACWVLAIWRPP